MFSLIKRRRTRSKAIARTLELPIHPCVELQHWVGTVLCMAWDGELDQPMRDRLLDEINRDPAAVAFAHQIQQDEALLRSAFSMLTEPVAA